MQWQLLPVILESSTSGPCVNEDESPPFGAISLWHTFLCRAVLTRSHFMPKPCRCLFLRFLVSPCVFHFQPFPVTLLLNSFWSEDLRWQSTVSRSWSHPTSCDTVMSLHSKKVLTASAPLIPCHDRLSLDPLYCMAYADPIYKLSRFPNK